MSQKGARKGVLCYNLYMNLAWNKVTWFSKLLALVLLLVVFAISFLLGVEFQQAQDSLLPTTHTPTVPKEVVPKTPDGWQIYSNEKYGYSILHPPTWRVETQSNSEFSSDTSEIIINTTSLESTEQLSYPIKISVEKNPEKYSAKEYVDKVFKQMFDGGMAESIDKEFPTKIGQYDAYEIYGISGVDDSIWEEVFIAHGDTILNISLPTDSQPYNKYILTPEGNNTIAHQILSTLILTSSITISDWKTYRNEEYGLEFKYPPEWVVKNTSRGAGYAVYELSVYPVDPDVFCGKLINLQKTAMLCGVTPVLQIYEENSADSYVRIGTVDVYSAEQMAKDVLSMKDERSYILSINGKRLSINVSLELQNGIPVRKEDISASLSSFILIK